LVASLPILTFHALDDLPSASSFAPESFRRAMAWLRESGFHSLDLLEAVDCLRRGAAYPVLERHGVCAPVFSIVGERASTESVQGGYPYLIVVQGHARSGPHLAKSHAGW
jgi:hypothetical protein